MDFAYGIDPYANGPRGVDSKGPKPVASYAPNPFGLYQVHGNGWEWTEDCYNKRYTKDTPTDGARWLEERLHKAHGARRPLELVGEHAALRLSLRRLAAADTAFASSEHWTRRLDKSAAKRRIEEQCLAHHGIVLVCELNNNS